MSRIIEESDGKNIKESFLRRKEIESRRKEWDVKSKINECNDNYVRKI
jgi:hypothetical protein